MTIATVIADDKFTSSDIGLAVRPDVTYEEWYAYGERLSRAYSKMQFLIGDWLNAGEQLFGEKYAQALEDKLYSYGTLRNYASICARIPYENRSLKLTFHQTKHVACLEPHEQRAIIDAAVKHDMTGDDILEAVQRVTGKKTTHESCEGTITRTYTQDDGRYFVVKADIDLRMGQVISIRLK